VPNRIMVDKNGLVVLNSISLMDSLVCAIRFPAKSLSSSVLHDRYGASKNFRMGPLSRRGGRCARADAPAFVEGKYRREDWSQEETQEYARIQVGAVHRTFAICRVQCIRSRSEAYGGEGPPSQGERGSTG
jgi:hypothetical protein